MSSSVVILGAGGLAREVRDVLEADGRHRLVAFVVDPEFALAHAELDGVLIHPFAWLREDRYVRAVCGVGLPEVRRRLAAQAGSLGAPLAPPIGHPSATRGRGSIFGDGTVLAAGVSVTSRVFVGKNVILNLHATMGHDARIEDHAAIMPGVRVSGRAQVGEGAYLGVGAVVLDGVRVGAWARVGAGAVVREDVPPNATVVGVPARVVRQREAGWHLP